MSSRRALLGVWLALATSACGLEPALPEPGAGPCADGEDDDGDGRTDYPYDPGCESAGDPSEDDPGTPRACSDGLDNDGDGRVDFDANGDLAFDAGDDPGCDSAADDDEGNVVLPACGDGVDNDDDDLTDLDDPGCQNLNDADEAG